MTTPDHERTTGRPAPPGGRRWRIGTPLVFALSGALFLISANNSQGTDLRPGRATTMASLVRSESANVERLQARARNLTRDVDDLSAAVTTRRCSRSGPRRGRCAARPASPRSPAPASPSPWPTPRARSGSPPTGALPVRRPPAGHPGRGQRDVGRRRPGDHDPGPADHLHHRHQVRRQLRGAARHPLPPALRDPARRRPDRAAGAAGLRPLRPRLPPRRRRPRGRRSAGPCSRRPRSPRRRTAASRGCPTPAQPPTDRRVH